VSVRKQLLRVAEEEAKGWAARYRRIERFSKIVAAIDEIVTT